MAQTVNLKGPIFRTDAGKRVKKAIGKAVDTVAKDGKRNVTSQLTQGHGRDTGAYRRGIKKRKKGLSATVRPSNMMIATWLEGTSRRNRTTRFKGYQIMQNASEKTDREAGEEARKLVRELIKELS